MTYLHSLWAGADKGGQNKSGRCETVILATPSQSHPMITAPVYATYKNSLRGRRYKPSSRDSIFGSRGRPIGAPKTSDSPEVGHFISRITRDGLENLWRCGKVLVSHAVSLLVRGTSGLEPGQLRKQSPARSFSFIPQTYGMVNG
jgi:hypothetical protein